MRTVRERSVVGRNTRRRAVPVLRTRKGVRRRASCEEFVHHFGGCRVERLKEVGFYVDHPARREKRIEHALQLEVRHWLKNVEKRLAKTAQGFQDVFGLAEITVISTGNCENAAEVRKSQRSALNHDLVRDSRRPVAEEA